MNGILGQGAGEIVLSGLTAIAFLFLWCYVSYLDQAKVFFFKRELSGPAIAFFLFFWVFLGPDVPKALHIKGLCLHGFYAQLTCAIMLWIVSYGYLFSQKRSDFQDFRADSFWMLFYLGWMAHIAVDKFF